MTQKTKADVQIADPKSVLNTMRTSAKDIEIYGYLVEGKPMPWMISTIMERYGVTQKTATMNIRGVKEDIKNYYKEHKEEMLEEHLSKYDLLYNKCIEKKDYETAMKVLGSKEKLLKMGQVTPNVTLNQINLGSYSTEQLLKFQDTINTMNNSGATSTTITDVEIEDDEEDE